jgi:hypothetical protein
MLGNLGHDIECSIFGIIDMAYTGGPIYRLNYKGIIKSDSTKKVIRPKIAYYSIQNVTSVFDHTLSRIPEVRSTHNSKMPSSDQGTVLYTASTDRSLSVYGYQHKNTQKQVYTIWADDYIPKDDNTTKPLTFTFTNGNFVQPVLVDMITGGVYEIPASQWSREGDKYTFRNIPVYDAPVLIADKSLVKIR